MIFNGKSLHELNTDDFEHLIINQIPEGPDLEYKEVAYSGRADDIREMLRDVISIANANGGYLILGIREDEFGRAQAIIPFGNLHEKVQSILQVCVDGISERIIGLEVKAFEFSTDIGIIVIHIPTSNHRPHMVTRENRTDFYRRYETHKRSMTLEEIRSTILSNPIYQGFVESQLLTSGRVIQPGLVKNKAIPPYVRIFTDKSVEQFLNKYITCDAFPQNLVIVSPYISDLSGELIDLKNLVRKINADKTITYVITRPPKDKYQHESMNILAKSPSLELRYNENIHAKLYICWCRKSLENSFALFGSGNLTSGGIRQNLELGMMVYSRDYGRTLVKDLYEWSTVSLRSQSKRIKPAIRG